jgi:hypothetical protein
MEITGIFGEQETVSRRSGWMVLDDPVGMDNQYIVGAPIYRAEGVRSPAWEWNEYPIDGKVQLDSGQSILDASYGRSPAWELDGV